LKTIKYAVILSGLLFVTLLQRVKDWQDVDKQRMDKITVQPFTIWGKAVHEEMRIFNECGIPEEEIWTIATSKAGKALKLPMLGTIQEKAPADLLLFEKNPIEDLKNLNSLMAVVCKGKIFRVKDMDKALMQWKKHFNGMIFNHMSVSAGKKAMIQFNNKHESIMQQLQ